MGIILFPNVIDRPKNDKTKNYHKILHQYTVRNRYAALIFVCCCPKTFYDKDIINNGI